MLVGESGCVSGSLVFALLLGGDACLWPQSCWRNRFFYYICYVIETINGYGN